MPEINDNVVLMAHGGGGGLTRELIETMMRPALNNAILEQMDDAAVLPALTGDMVFTTDSYVVDPIFFPGGNIGNLAVCGTVNDLAMQGAAPKYLSLALIIEEGMPLSQLQQVITAVAAEAKALDLPVVTGDTKVVERGHGGTIYINTAGIGQRQPGIACGVRNALPGDVVILTGTIADHGVAIMSRREGLAFESEILSDVAALWPLVRNLLEACPRVHALRDPTRGGVTAALCDIATASKVGITIRESVIPIQRQVRAACQMLGLDPLNVANEGKAIVIVPEKDAETALRTLRRHHLGAEAAIIGTVATEHPGMVILETNIGGQRILTVTAGEELPRIC